MTDQPGRWTDWSLSPRDDYYEFDDTVLIKVHPPLEENVSLLRHSQMLMIYRLQPFFCANFIELLFLSVNFPKFLSKQSGDHEMQISSIRSFDAAKNKLHSHQLVLSLKR